MPQSSPREPIQESARLRIRNSLQLIDCTAKRMFAKRHWVTQEDQKRSTYFRRILPRSICSPKGLQQIATLLPFPTSSKAHAIH